MGLYLIFPLILTLKQKHFRRFAVLTSVVYLVSQAIHLFFYARKVSMGEYVDLVFFFPPNHINQFMIGMLTGYLFSRFQNKPLKLRFVPPLAFRVIIVFLAFRPDNISYHTGLIAPLFAVLVLSIALNKSSILNFPLFVFLGEISYGFYILQQPVYSYLEMVNNKYFLLRPTPFLCCSLLALTLIASLLYYAVELPIMKLASNRKHRSR